MSGLASPESPRLQLVGFTSAVYDGNLGGVLGSTQRCQIDFPGSRMCTIEEIQETLDLPAPIADFAWMEPRSSSCRGDLIINDMDVASPQWTCNALDAPCRMVVGADTGVSFESTGSVGFKLSCSVKQPIACCAQAL